MADTAPPQTTLGDRKARASLLVLARNWVRKNLRPGEVDPHATLAFFRFLRTNAAAKSMYLKATGCITGFEVDHPGKDVANPQIGKAVKLAMRALSAQHEQGGQDIIEPVDGQEFILTYTRLAPPAGGRAVSIG